MKGSFVVVVLSTEQRLKEIQLTLHTRYYHLFKVVIYNINVYADAVTASYDALTEAKTRFVAVPRGQYKLRLLSLATATIARSVLNWFVVHNLL